MTTGTVKTLVRDRGFGFIQTPGSSEDVFFHTSSLVDGSYDALKEGDSVDFEIEADSRNPSRKRAIGVKVNS